MIDIENFPVSASALRMMEMVTKGFYDRAYVAKWLYQIMGEEIDSTHLLMKELPDQVFPETATWGLTYHEIKWGLPVRKNLSYEERRRLIYGKRDYRAPMTPYRMEALLRDVSGCKVCISDIHDPGRDGYLLVHPNIFKVAMEAEGAAVNLSVVLQRLRRIKQSHTTFVFFVTTEIKTKSGVRPDRITFSMKAPFWYAYLLNGDWILDGSHLLDAGLRYSMRAAINSIYGIKTQGDILARQAVKTTVKEAGSTSEKMRFVLFVHGAEKESAAVTVRAGILTGNAEGIGDMMVTVSSPGYWCLDGTVNLDGSKTLNSIYREEEIE